MTNFKIKVKIKIQKDLFVKLQLDNEVNKWGL